jgi:plasmid stability protein
MAKIRIKNFPDELYARLEAQAKRTGQSIQDEVIDTLRYAVATEKLRRKPQHPPCPGAKSD